MLGTDIGIDLGTANVLVYIKGKGLIFREPTVVAVDIKTKKIIAIGSEAREMLGRTPQNIIAIRPLSQGVISSFDLTEKMLKYYISKAIGKTIKKPRVSICVPSGVSEVERRAVEEVAYKAGAGKVQIVDEPIAAAIGAGINIDEPCGRLIVDIGGGTTDVAVISLGGLVINSSIKVAGDDFDEVILKYVKSEYNILIGEMTAERIKMEVGSLYTREEVLTIEVNGRNLVTGLPRKVAITSEEMIPILNEVALKIVDAILLVLEKTPPELAADIAVEGIMITGGGSLLYGIDRLIESKTGIPVTIADDPLSTVAIGLQHRMME
ncbi:MAG: rod shape-determining protein [Firmicutes bacterium HGW-Firmicutes-7]|nr:MAG: rod shape-determining protein [Firmicutes bacterium HGW-Firmicutes-7]